MVKKFENYLNGLSGDMPPDAFIIGGKMRHEHQEKGTYGTALRMYDMEAFNKRYQAWRQRELNKPKNLKQ